MIVRKEFEEIRDSIKLKVEQLFDYIETKSTESDYLLFLAQGEYLDQITNPSLNWNPNAIDFKLDDYKDESRQSFFFAFMRQFYNFPKTLNQTDNDTNKMTVELMIYCHIWESKPYLKQLYRLAQLVDGKVYPWKVVVPETSRQDFISNEIRDTFKKNDIAIHEVITAGFHSSLRNAFAHSEYNFDNHNELIHLDNYKGKSWDIKYITYDNWTLRFVNSALLSYHISEERYQRRRNIVTTFGKTEFQVVFPQSKTSSKILLINYDEKSNHFNFQ